MLIKRFSRNLSPLLSFLSNFPKLKRLVKTILLAIWRVQVRYTARGLKDLPDPYKLYWINPSEITHVIAKTDYEKYGDRGKVIGGDWDNNTILFTDLDVYKALKARFILGMPWRETEFYHRVLNEIIEGRQKWQCKTQSDLDNRLHELDLIFEDIKVHGYKSQYKIAQDQDVSFLGEDEITVRIDRQGHPLFEDGRHRLAIAKLLDLDLIPIKVTARHSEWYGFIKEVISFARAHNGKVYQPVPHFDLCDIPSHHGHERFEMIEMNLPFVSGDLLDIGAHWGYFCHRFEDLGYNCYAVESDIESIYFMEKLKLAKNKKFKVVASSIFDYQDKNDFDVVLALNIFHHFLKNQEQYDALIEFLQHIQTKAMFFQPHQPNSPQMQGAYKDFQPAEFVDFVKRFSGLNVAEYIGAAHDKRPIYFLRRE